MASLEARRTARTPGWRIALLAFVLGLYGVVVLTWLATRSSGGGIAYGLAVSLTLASGLVFLPVLTGRSIAGDRESGRLDLLRSTRVRAIEHALGLLLVAAGLAVLLVLVTVPLLVLAALGGGVDLVSLASAPVVLWWSLTAVGAVGSAASALTRRARYGVALGLLATGALVAGTALAYAVAVPVTEIDRDRQVRVDAEAAAPQNQACTTVTRSMPTPRTELVWWLLAPNPVVVVADAAPASRSGVGSFDPLGAVSSAVRHARDGVGEEIVEECWGGAVTAARPDASSGAPVWPWGLAGLTALAAGATAVVEQGLRTPSRPKGDGIGRRARLLMLRRRRRREGH